MTDEQRELAEWVARWAGWMPSARLWRMPGSMSHLVELEDALTSEALAWRALEEMMSREGVVVTTVWRRDVGKDHLGYSVSRHRLCEDGKRIYTDDRNLKNCIFRALRAAKEES